MQPLYILPIFWFLISLNILFVCVLYSVCARQYLTVYYAITHLILTASDVLGLITEMQKVQITRLWSANKEEQSWELNSVSSSFRVASFLHCTRAS